MSKYFIDVREPSEFEDGHVEGAINMPASRLMSDLHELESIPKDSELIVYCRSGSRSNVAINILKQHGFTHLTNGINKDQVSAKYL